MLILRTDKSGTFPRMTEIGVKRFFRLTVESSLSDGILRYGLTVRTPLTGTIRHFGFDAE